MTENEEMFKGEEGEGSDMFEEEDEELGGLEESSPTEHTCPKCSERLCDPRVLSCLHVFCSKCLEGLVGEGATLECPKCQMHTPLGSAGVKALPADHVLANLMDVAAITAQTAVCTSCKSNEKAVARCADCANFLCPNCNSAHQLMRCFEGHRVESFEELTKSDKKVPIHKPILCAVHPSESLKFFCYTCQVPICNECILVNHSLPEHHFERLADAEGVQRKELQDLVTKSKENISKCEETSALLSNALSELENQRENAKSLIEETFQSYKALLEKCMEKALDDLGQLHSEQELRIMEGIYGLEKFQDHAEEACKFTERLLENGNAAETLSLKKLIGDRLQSLAEKTPKPNVEVDLKFETDYNKFEEALKATFGQFKSMKKEKKVEEPKAEAKEEPEQAVLGPIKVDVEESPSSLPISMQSSFGSDFVPLPTSTIASPASTGGPLSPPQGLSNFSTIQEYNIAQLANLATGPASRNSNPSPTNPFTLSELLADPNPMSHAYNNLQALAKLGGISLDNHDLNNGHMNGSTNGGGFGRPQVTSPNLDASLLSNAVSALNLNGGGGGFHSSSTSPLQDDLELIGNGNNSMSAFSQQVRSTGSSKTTPMQIRCKFGQLGPNKGQFNSPHGFCLGNDEDIVVADTNNHRIQVFDKTGNFKFQFGIPGKEEGQLWYPRKVAVMRNSGKFVVCDRGNERSRMQIFTKNGHFIKKIAIRYIDIVAGLAVNSTGQIVAVDSVSPTVFVIAESGDLLRWFDCSDYMREPSDIAISGKEFFVCDFKGHCVVVFNEDGQFVRRIGNESYTNFPNGIDISDAGDVLVGDSHGNRFHVAVFTREGSLLSEFECPYVKVSRCCGLKITSEGYVVTLAKNNHHVLVLNTLYIV
ncbi:tripartite motif-containing protein 2-like isoform X2 [Neocloeon triangulifer]|nr:tripartite motif-containing protein 2-like isoform X2 [Neocloeon triangulifer]XP_059482960.1 tripartite motif-containing protein 2-like isoform X2 [Neocloeon triangulifer]